MIPTLLAADTPPSSAAKDFLVHPTRSSKPPSQGHRPCSRGRRPTVPYGKLRLLRTSPHPTACRPALPRVRADHRCCRRRLLRHRHLRPGRSPVRLPHPLDSPRHPTHDDRRRLSLRQARAGHRSGALLGAARARSALASLHHSPASLRETSSKQAQTLAVWPLQPAFSSMSHSGASSPG